MSSALNPHAAFAFSSASLLFRERLVCSPGCLPPLKGGPWRRIATHSVSSLSAPSLPPGTVSPRPLSQHLLQGQFKLPIGPLSRSGPLREAASSGEGGGGGRGKGRAARSPAGSGQRQRAAAGGAGGCVREEAARAGELRGGAAGNGESRSAGPAGAAARAAEGRGVGWPRGLLPTYAGRHIDEVEQRRRQREEEERGEQRAARQPQQPPAGAHAEPAAARGPARAPLPPLRFAAWASAAAFRASRAAASPLSAAGRRGPGHMRREGGRRPEERSGGGGAGGAGPDRRGGV